MGPKIALTGIGVINGSLRGVNHFNQKIYDTGARELFPEINNPDDLIAFAVKDAGSSFSGKDFNKSAIIQLAHGTSDMEPSSRSGFNQFHVVPDLSSALAKAFLLLVLKPAQKGLKNEKPMDSVIVISSAGAIVLRNFDLAVSKKKRIYATLDKPVSMGHPGMDENKDGDKDGDKRDRNTSITGDVSLLTICCEDPKNITPAQLEKTAALIPARGKKSVAAGFAHDSMAGLIVTSLCICNRYYPGQNSIGPHLDIIENQACNTPFYFPFSSRTWFRGKNRKRKAVLSWTQDEDDFFLIISESGSRTIKSSGYAGLSTPGLFPVAAASREKLRKKLEKMSSNALESDDLRKMARKNFLEFQLTADKEFTAVVMGVSSSDIKREAGFLASGLEKSFNSGNCIKTPGGSYFTPAPLSRTGKLVFVYPGVGSAYTGLGRDLFQMFPGVYDHFSRMTLDVGSFVKERELYPRISHELSRDELKLHDQNLRQNIMDISQCGMSFSVIYTMIMAGIFNVFPEFALGYSMGEASMMASLMVWKNPEELSERLKKNNAFSKALANELTAVRKAWNLSCDDKKTTGDKIWESFTLLEDRKKVEEIVHKEKRVYITLVNTGQEVVIAGDPEKCLQVIKKLNCKYFPLKLALAIHSKPAYLAYDKLVDLYSLELNSPSSVKLYSSSCYLPVPPRKKAVANSIAKAFCDTVDFPRLVGKVYDDGGRIFVETGPRQTCSLWIEQILAGKKFLTVPLNIKGVRDQISMARALSMLMSHGVNLNVESLYEF